MVHLVATIRCLAQYGTLEVIRLYTLILCCTIFLNRVGLLFHSWQPSSGVYQWRVGVLGEPSHTVTRSGFSMHDGQKWGVSMHVGEKLGYSMNDAVVYNKLISSSKMTSEPLV